MYFLRDKKGITLVELMITITIVGIIGLGVGTLFTKGMQLWQMNKAKAEIERDVRTALDLIIQNIRQAEDSTIVIDRYDANQPPYSRITFTSVKGGTISYYQKGTELFQNTAAGDYRLMENLRNVTFTYEDTELPDEGEVSVINCSVCAETHVWAARTKVFQLNAEKIRVMNN